jgi:hypothetical protein
MSEADRVTSIRQAAAVCNVFVGMFSRVSSAVRGWGSQDMLDSGGALGRDHLMAYL